jgi:hypothetical protein
MFFKDISKLAPIKNQILRHRFMYRVFGSGAIHSPYAIFQKMQDHSTAAAPLGYCVLLLNAYDGVLHDNASCFF